MSKRNCLIVSIFLVFILAFSGMLFGQRVIDLNKVWGDMRVMGDDADDNSGSAVAHGDINGDGYMDIIIGAPSADPFERNLAGEVYVIFGSINPQSTIDLITQPADISVYGDDDYDYSGYAVASGDVNGDGYYDLIIGAYGADPGGRNRAGETYIIFGNSFSTPPYTIDLRYQPATITICGEDDWDMSGSSVASGDVNGDGYMDIIIGAINADPGGRTNAGETYVIFGSSSPPSTIDLSIESADITVYGDDVWDASGYPIASGDINGDAYYDIIIGAYHADPPGGSEAGETYVIFGSDFPSPPYTIDLDTQSADITIYGDNPHDHFGSAVASGDINCDGYDDIIIGAYWADPLGRYDAGETCVIFGASFSSPPYTIDLNSQPADITLYGDDADDYSGWAVTRGDINNDGYDDIIIGANGANPGGRIDAGETYVIFGGSFPSPPYTIDLRYQPATITINGDDAGDDSGIAIASGDVNGDEYDDLIIGAYKADPPGGANAGETYLVLGGGVAIITAHGFDGRGWIKVSDNYGNYVRRFQAFWMLGNPWGEVHLAVGDIDGDGLDEIVAGQGEGGDSYVKLFEMDGTLIRKFKAFWPAGNPGGEVHLAIGNFDTNPDDKEIAVAQGEEGQSWVKVFKSDGTFIRRFRAFWSANPGGEVHLAAADLENSDGIDEIIAGMGEGGSSWVKIFSHQGTLIRRFQVFDSTENPGGEVHLAVGNFDADLDLEISVATGYNGGNWVKLFKKDATFIRKITVFGGGGNLKGEVHITSADMDNDGIWEIICGHGEGGSSRVTIFKADGTRIRSFKAFGPANSQGEVHLAKSKLY